MNFMKQSSSTEIDRAERKNVDVEIRELVSRESGGSRQVDDDVQLATNNLETLMRRMSGTSTREIDNLIGELKVLREKLATDGSNVQRELAEYAELNQSVIQLTKIISEGMTHLKKAPVLPKAGGLAPKQSDPRAAQNTREGLGTKITSEIS